MTREEFLISLAEKYGSDKHGSHFYMSEYARHLPEKCRSMLEIGVLKGASAFIWNDFYGKEELDLYLLDLYLDPDNVSPRWVKNNGWTPIIGDQSDSEVLSFIRQKFNVIVDDGSHNAHHQIISFKHLFLNNLSEGGQYYIEDAACNLEKFYWGGEVKAFEDTPLSMFKVFKETGKIVNPYFNAGEAETFESLIKNVEILSKDELILIERK